MPNRIIRAELLESEAWLALKDNADRSCWLACFLTVDNLGNMPAGPFRLLRLWRPYGIDTSEKVAQILSSLADVDLIRQYQADGKPYLHIPRFGQELRYLGTVWPPSPWTTNEQKQKLEQKTHVNHAPSPGEVEVEVDVDVDKKRTSTAAPNHQPVDNSTSKPATWSEVWKAKGKALGINPNPGETNSDYCRRVHQFAKSMKVKP